MHKSGKSSTGQSKYPTTFCRYQAEMDAIMTRWKRLAATLQDNAQRIQELMAKLMQFEVRRITRFIKCC